ncbi:hypothetical protein [Castellaniella caeni]|uniref:hypothetical protein n=1 Tax=Castellaniella caeni TaxID=266123 RepID=UPI00083314A7|nr:hypothetical protein [Castellaniella caeni]
MTTAGWPLNKADRYLYPIIGRGANQLFPFKAKIATAVRSKNTHWVMRDIARRHWVTVGTAHGVMAPDGQGVEAVLDEMVAQTPEVVHTVRAQLPDGFPAHVADSILSGLQTAAEKLAK